MRAKSKYNQLRQNTTPLPGHYQKQHEPYRRINMKNRHIIIRAIMAVIWLAAGVIALLKSQLVPGMISLALCALFGFSAFSMSKKA